MSLFERVLTRACIRPSRSRVGDTSRFFDDEQGCLSGDSGITDLSPEAGELIDSLGQRARYWMHASGGYAEGIHGWLTAEEARRLHSLAADFTVSPMSRQSPAAERALPQAPAPSHPARRRGAAACLGRRSPPYRRHPRIAP